MIFLCNTTVGSSMQLEADGLDLWWPSLSLCRLSLSSRASQSYPSTVQEVSLSLNSSQAHTFSMRTRSGELSVNGRSFFPPLRRVWLSWVWLSECQMPLNFFPYFCRQDGVTLLGQWPFVCHIQYTGEKIKNDPRHLAQRRKQGNQIYTSYVFYCSNCTVHMHINVMCMTYPGKNTCKLVMRGWGVSRSGFL